MVWVLTPVNSSSGLSRHHFIPQGTYKVGRKGSSPITNDILDAVIAKKPIVLYDWLQAMMGQASSLSEIPECSSFAPTLTLKRGQEYEMVKIADPKFQETCLSGFTFVIGPLHSYHYKERLWQVLEVGGATMVPVSQMCGSIQKADISEKRIFLLVPEEGARKSIGTESDKLPYIKKIPRLSEDKAIVAVLSGEFNASAYKFPMSPVTSSRTEETVDIADSDDEVEVTTSHQYSKFMDSKGTTSTCNTKTYSSAGERKSVSDENETTKFKSVSEVNPAQFSSAKLLTETSVNQTVLPIETVTVDKENLPVGRKSVEIRTHEVMESANMQELKVETKIHSKREEKDVISETNDHQSSDIIYNKNLIVRKDGDYGNTKSSSKEATPNFKCFRRKNAISGNSFNDLIPFARDPYKSYRESDYAREMAEYIKEEKKRKEAEALAEDLFNAERVKGQRGTAGSSFTRSFSRQKVR